MWNFYREKGDYRDFFVSYACHNLDRSPTIFAAQQRAAAEKAKQQKQSDKNDQQKLLHEEMCNSNDKKATPQEKLVADLAVYNIRYNPPNFKQFDLQQQEFSDLLNFCKAKQISVLVVAMPITDQNRNLLDKNLLARYETELPELTQKSGGKFLKLDKEPMFALSDFEDSVHTNAAGGKKVQDKILQAVSQNNMLM